MLDNCSQGGFVKTELLEELEVEGTNTSVTIKTLNGNQKHSSVAVDGLEVSNVAGIFHIMVSTIHGSQTN